ncbi:MAG TPA: shikimate dehydrogenase [Micromonosporaceae bacterium]
MSVHRRAAVLGRPVAHSLSPVIHNAGYRALGLVGWSYTAIECAEAELPDLVAGLGPEWAGLSLTMPLKEAALRVADEVSPVAAVVGAANTLVRRRDGSWYADNTDVTGMVDTLVAVGVPAGVRIVVLGAGGTARAALAAAARLRSSLVTVCVRRRAAGEELGRVAEALGLRWEVRDWSEAAALGETDVLISTVPRGATDHLADAAIFRRPGTVLFDVLYDPWPTPLAASALAAGCRVVSGLDLLLAQAVYQFERFTGARAPVEAMRSALTVARTHAQTAPASDPTA